MTMTTVPDLWQCHPQGWRVFDAHGRQLDNVIACNPETGEVITHDVPWIAHAWMRLLWTRVDRAHPLRPLCRPGWTYFLHRHGFWPAPLRVVPKPVRLGGPVPADQAYIVGNGDREVLLE